MPCEVRHFGAIRTAASRRHHPFAKLSAALPGSAAWGKFSEHLIQRIYRGPKGTSVCLHGLMRQNCGFHWHWTSPALGGRTCNAWSTALNRRRNWRYTSRSDKHQADSLWTIYGATSRARSLLFCSLLWAPFHSEAVFHAPTLILGPSSTPNGGFLSPWGTTRVSPQLCQQSQPNSKG